MSFHIGKSIKKRIKERGWSIKKFAEDANMSYRNALYLFDRTDISVQQLQQISKVLDYDFVGLYEGKPEITTETPEQTESAKHEKLATLTFNFGISPEAYDSIAEFMREINVVAEKHGIKVL